MGQKGVKNGVFRHFLKNKSKDFARFHREGRSYSDTYVYQISCSGKIWFSRYGAKRGQNWGFSAFSQKVSLRFGSFSQEKKIL